MYVVSSLGHSELFMLHARHVFQHVTLKSLEWPGDEAIINYAMYSYSYPSLVIDILENALRLDCGYVLIMLICSATDHIEDGVQCSW